MKRLRIVGVDPGPVPGVVRLDYPHPGARPTIDVVQCTAALFWDLLPDILDHTHDDQLTVLAVEDYAITRKSGRVNAGAANQATLTMARTLRQSYPHAVHRNAGAVKPWATDVRLEAAGIHAATRGMRHARDAGRHALYAAVRDLGATDPLASDYPRTRP